MFHYSKVLEPNELETLKVGRGIALTRACVPYVNIREVVKNNGASTSEAQGEGWCFIAEGKEFDSCALPPSFCIL